MSFHHLLFVDAAHRHAVGNNGVHRLDFCGWEEALVVVRGLVKSSHVGLPCDLWRAHPHPRF